MERDPMRLALSTEIVMDIVLSHLKVRDLISCRLVSKFWNTAASSTLRRRRSTMMKNISSETDLITLEQCMEQSLDFPFTGLEFDRPWSLDSDRATDFFIKYGARFKRLILSTSWNRSIFALAPFMNHLPNLAILEVGYPRGYSQDFEIKSSAAGLETGGIKLSSVRTIRIPSPCPEINEDVLHEVLIATTSPSLKIECMGVDPAVIRAVQSCGKLQAISAITLEPSYAVRHEELLKMCQQLSRDPPALTILHFNVGYLNFENGAHGIASGLQTILLSSQHSLKELLLDCMEGIRISWEEVCPTFTKLARLSVLDTELGVLFHGLSGDNFPVLRDLEIEISYLGSKNELKGLFWDGVCLPSVKTIDFDGYITQDGMEHLDQIFPNVTEVRLFHGYYSGEYHPSVENPFEIWNVRAFKNLAKLTISSYHIKRPSKKNISMDSFLTGMSFAVCQNLLKKQRLNADSDGSDDIVRDNPNLLQLKNLKELIVSVTPAYGVKNLHKGMPFMSMLSVWYALDMMPNLRARFVYDSHLPSYYEKRDKAVFKAAFKHVNPYMELEPFADRPNRPIHSDNLVFVT